jgi:hypothetical protein
MSNANCDISWQQQPFLHFDQKPSQYKTLERNYQEISRLKDIYRFLSPATKSLHDSIEKANKESEFKYNVHQLKEA